MTNISHLVAHVIFLLHNAGLDSTEHLEWSFESPESPVTSLLKPSSGFTHPSGANKRSSSGPWGLWQSYVIPPNTSQTPSLVTLALATPFRHTCLLAPLPTCQLGFHPRTSACTAPSAQNSFLYTFGCHSLLPSGLCARVTTLFKVGVHTRACMRTHTHPLVPPVPSLLCFSFLHGAYHRPSFSLASLLILGYKFHEGKNLCVSFTDENPVPRRAPGM